MVCDLGGRGSCLYDLYAVSNHMGTARGGHYTAYARHPYSGEWHHFNDTRFPCCPPTCHVAAVHGSVHNDLFTCRCSTVSKKTVVSSEAYVLFYERRGSCSGSHLWASNKLHTTLPPSPASASKPSIYFFCFSWKVVQQPQLHDSIVDCSLVIFI